MKKKFSISYLSPAEKDLEDIFVYIGRDCRKRAIQFLEKIDRTVRRLGRFPRSGLVPRDPHLRRRNYRVLVIGNYLAFYRFERGAIVIYRIVHGKRRHEFLL